MSTEETTTPRVPKTVAECWPETVERIRGREQEGVRVILWDAESADQHHASVAAGIMHLPDAGFGMERLAFALRDTLWDVTGDRTISVVTCELDDDGAGDAEGWGRRGVAESYQVNPFSDEYDPEEHEYDDEDQDDDEEVLNELDSLSREDDQHDELDPAGAEVNEEDMAAEVAEIMRESAEAADDIRHFPDGTRILPHPAD